MAKLMKYLLPFLMLFSSTVLADCKWSKAQAFEDSIPEITWKFCIEKSGKSKVDVNGILLEPNKKFVFRDRSCPECVEVYSTPNKSRDFTVISMRNEDLDSNVWVLDLRKKKVVYFSDEVHGRHIDFDWKGGELIITHAGMGYGTEYYVKPIKGQWKVYKTEEIKF